MNNTRVSRYVLLVFFLARKVNRFYVSKVTIKFRLRQNRNRTATSLFH